MHLKTLVSLYIVHILNLYECTVLYILQSSAVLILTHCPHLAFVHVSKAVVLRLGSGLGEIDYFRYYSINQ